MNILTRSATKVLRCYSINILVFDAIEDVKP